MTENELGPADNSLLAYAKAGYSIWHIVTPEEQRAELEVLKVAQTLQRELFVYSITEGLQRVASGKTKTDKKMPPPAFLQQIKEKDNAIVIARDFHAFFKDPMVLRGLRDLGLEYRQRRSILVMIGAVSKLPPELERDVVVIDFDLPTHDQMDQIFGLLHDKTTKTLELAKKEAKKKEAKVGLQSKLDVLTVTDVDQELIVKAAMGLTSVEGENAFSKAMVEAVQQAEVGNEVASLANIVMKEKAQIVKKNGILEYFEARDDANSIGGLAYLKAWMAKRERAFTQEARDFGLPQPKGILLVGLPGCGKSLSARACSNMLRVPLIRFDMGKIYGSLVGASEENMRSALKTIEAIGPCVVWIDEMEKGFAGTSGGSNFTSDVARRVGGQFLTWLSEKDSPSFIVATLNSLDGIPPEMTRRGRFDEIFFVGLPTQQEREEIVRIHIAKHGRDPDKFDATVLAKAAEHFSGAEIESAIVDGLYNAFYNSRDLETGDVMETVSLINPLAVSKEDELSVMVSWAEKNAINASSGARSRKLVVSRNLDL